MTTRNINRPQEGLLSLALQQLHLAVFTQHVGDSGSQLSSSGTFSSQL